MSRQDIKVASAPTPDHIRFFSIAWLCALLLPILKPSTMLSKVLAVLLIIGYASARYIPAYGGTSVGTQYQDDYGNYGFKYQITDHLGASNGRAEYGDEYGNKMGSYNIVDIDGRVRKVNYVADVHGFRADIKTNEPGTQSSVSGASTYNAAVVPFGSGPAHGALAPSPSMSHIVHAAPPAYGGYAAASSPYHTAYKPGGLGGYKAHHGGFGLF